MGCEVNPLSHEREAPPPAASVPASLQAVDRHVAWPTETPQVAPSPTSTSELTQGINTFGYELFQRITAQASGENCAMSPWAIASPLGGLTAFASGETAHELVSTLHLERVQQLLPALRAAHLVLDPKERAQSVEVHQGWFGDRLFRFNPQFLSSLSTELGTPLTQLDFRGEPESSRAELNRWVGERTLGRIDQLLGPGHINRATRLVIISTIYLKADWKVAFDPKATTQAPFYSAPSAPTQVATLRAHGKYHYAHTGEAALVQLPFADPTLALTLILPAQRYGLTELIKRTSWADVEAWHAQLKQRELSLSFPRFTIDRPQALDLAPLLKELGIKRVLSERAELARMTSPTEASLHLSDVVHQALVKVDESGAEAAAATALTGGVAISAGGEGHLAFSADQPFLIVLRHLPSQIVLFLGIVTQPRASAAHAPPI
jgi:serpin B